MPSSIQLIHVFESDKYKLYLFRFKSDHDDWKEMGWMAGISGPYLNRGKTDDKTSGTYF